MVTLFARARNPRPSARPLRAIATLLAALALTACEAVPTVTGNTGQRIDLAAPVQVALLVPGNSGRSGDAQLASGLENAARLAVSDLGGVDIDLRIYNTAGNADRAAQAATAAVQEGAQIILGPVFGEAANAAGVAVAGDNVNVLSFSNNTDIAGGNVFVLGPTFENTAARLARFAAARGQERIVVVHDRTTAGQIGRRAIERAAADAGIAVAGTGSYDFSQQGIVEAVPSIAGTARSAGTDALFFTADSAGALPLITQLLADNRSGPGTYQYIGLTRWDIPPSTLSLPGLQGGWFALPDPGLGAQFSSRYFVTYGAQPHPIASLAYDGIAAIGALVRAGRGDALTKDALTQASGFVGVNGVFRLNRDGTNERALAVGEIRDGSVQVIDPAPRSFRGAGS